MSNPNMDQQGRIWKWAIEPHPYKPQEYDTLVTDDDNEALKAIADVAESYLWDTNEGPKTRTISVTHAPDFATLSGDIPSETTLVVLHDYHCPLDGDQLVEIGLGTLICRRCETQFVPALGPNEGEVELSWIQNAKNEGKTK